MLDISEDENNVSISMDCNEPQNKESPKNNVEVYFEEKVWYFLLQNLKDDENEFFIRKNVNKIKTKK